MTIAATQQQEQQPPPPPSPQQHPDPPRISSAHKLSSSVSSIFRLGRHKHEKDKPSSTGTASAHALTQPAMAQVQTPLSGNGFAYAQSQVVSQQTLSTGDGVSVTGSSGGLVSRTVSNVTSKSSHSQLGDKGDTSLTRRRVGDDWNFISTLGTGTFGRVFLVQHKSDASPTGRFYAMKTLQKSEVVRLRQVEHMNNEREILQLVQHPFIVSLRTSFQSAHNLFMCLDYVPGGELFSHLRRAVKFQNDVTRFYAAEILLALEHLHAHDIIYRDLKPENILIDADGHIKITDFGFAKRIADRTWTLCGTPEYLAPEIIQSRGHGKAVDWWALGILIYEMLCGYPPFYDSSHIGIYEKILAGKIRWPSHLEPQAIDVISRLLNPDITKRLGNLSRAAIDVKDHPWFRYCRWDLLMTKAIRPPIVPLCRSNGDTRNFDSYPELKRDQMQMLLAESQGDDSDASQYKREFAAWL
ncbi:Cytochrome c oxidase subunit 1 [Savitreella phatthalungensis]